MELKASLVHINVYVLTILIFLLFFLPFKSKSQEANKWIDFTKYVSKNYKLPKDLETNCEWMFAIVKISTDADNKIIKYEFVNEPLEGVKKGFDILNGYRFPKTMKINRRPVVFYLSIDNAETCIEKPGDIRFYAPNRVVNIITTYMQKIKRHDPNAILIPNLIYKKYYPTQR